MIDKVPIFFTRQTVWPNSNNNSYSYMLQELGKPHQWLDPLAFHPMASRHNIGIILLSLAAKRSPVDNRYLTPAALALPSLSAATM